MTAPSFSRADTSALGRWWWTVDRWSLLALLILISVGVILSFAASPPAADRLNLGGFYFVKRHLLMLIPSVCIIILVSLLTSKQIRRLASFIFLLNLLLMIATYFYGTEIKGAKRWISISGFSLQSSEFIKPAFAVLSAWMLAETLRNPHFPGVFISFFFLSLYIFLLLLQPDLGMTVVAIATWVGQLFIAGISLIWFGVIVFLGLAGFIGSYFLFPHVAHRIDQFLDPSSGDPRHDLYQIYQSLEAFSKGGLLGIGPGEGVIKKHVPDAHADFIFAVAGEEFGLILCLFLVSIFAFIVCRSLLRAIHENSLFVILAISGLIIQFGLQAIVNMASSLHLIPTKGMTMPFISYGGSSLLALGIGMGMVLALTRRRYGINEVL